jgi:hypothetical protein
VLLDPVAPVTLEKISAGTVHELTVTAQAPVAGGFVLNVAVTLADPLGEQTRVLAFPLLVGGSAVPAPVSLAKPDAPAIAGAAGTPESIVPLRGTETSR